MMRNKFLEDHFYNIISFCSGIFSIEKKILTIEKGYHNLIKFVNEDNFLIKIFPNSFKIMIFAEIYIKFSIKLLKWLDDTIEFENFMNILSLFFGFINESIDIFFINLDFEIIKKISSLIDKNLNFQLELFYEKFSEIFTLKCNNYYSLEKKNLIWENETKFYSQLNPKKKHIGNNLSRNEVKSFSNRVLNFKENDSFEIKFLRNEKTIKSQKNEYFLHDFFENSKKNLSHKINFKEKYEEFSQEIIFPQRISNYFYILIEFFEYNFEIFKNWFIFQNKKSKFINKIIGCFNENMEIILSNLILLVNF